MPGKQKNLGRSSNSYTPSLGTIATVAIAAVMYLRNHLIPNPYSYTFLPCMFMQAMATNGTVE